MSGPSEIRTILAALEERRVELEALIFEDLERRFFSETGEPSTVTSNSVEANGPDSVDSREQALWQRKLRGSVRDTKR